MEHGCHTEFAARQSLPQVGLHDPISRGRTEVFLLMTQFLQAKKLRTLCVAGSNRAGAYDVPQVQQAPEAVSPTNHRGAIP